MKKLRWSAIAAVVTLATLNLGAFIDPTSGASCLPRSSCPLSGEWRTVDQVPNASITGMASHHSTVYAVGASGGSWITRRSLDGGETWATVDQVPQAFATGVAVDPRNGAAYVAGRAGPLDTTTFQQRTWLARRSVDGGNTWATVDEVQVADKQPPLLASRVAVDSVGNVTVVGSLGLSSSPLPQAILRRSEDGGTTWTQYGIPAPLTFPTSVSASPSGALVVTGAQWHPTSSRLFTWVVAASSDGKTHWSTVDEFSLPSGQPLESLPYHSTISRDGTVAVGGFAVSDIPQREVHWVLRTASLGSLGQWTTIDDYVPLFNSQPARAMNQGVVFARDGRLFATGEQTTAGPDTLVTRMGTPSLRDFTVSDLVTESAAVAGESIPPLLFGTGAMARARNGEILAGGRFVNGAPTDRVDWLVRKLDCFRHAIPE